jgi:hypothetical protein
MFSCFKAWASVIFKQTATSLKRIPVMPPASVPASLFPFLPPRQKFVDQSSYHAIPTRQNEYQSVINAMVNASHRYSQEEMMVAPYRNAATSAIMPSFE